MGNAVPPRMCRKKPADVASGARRPRPKQDAATGAAAPDAAATPTMPRKQRGNDDKEEETKREGPRRRAKTVSWAGAVDDAGSKAASTAAATVATVKIVLKRKDAEALVARLNAQSARERKARMAELKGELRTGECGGGGGASPASCRDAWRPGLAPIKENQFWCTSMV